MAIATIFAIYWIFFTPENETSYEDEITLYRHQRAEFYRNSPQSPFIEQKVPFSYLDYFPASTSYKIEAEFTPSSPQKKLALATSTGGFDTLFIVGKATFKRAGQLQTLLVLGTSSSMEDGLFIPFLDATSGKTTYGAGRYLEIPPPKGSHISLDFNMSYNPYCAYTEGYTCPFPPKENRLKIAIEAGEKTYPAY